MANRISDPLFFLSALFAGLLSVAAAGLPATAATATVAAASDLRFALAEIADNFTARTGHAVRLTFGSSGNFSRQIRQGAPFDLFFSADENYVLGLARDGLTRGTGALYAVGQIVIFVPEGSPLQPDGSLNDLRHALEGGRLRKFAIANPEHAPYGKRAEEALRHEGLWAAIQSRLVLGENVSQAAQFAVSGSTDGGIIAYSLVLSPRMARRGRYALIPEALHSPLRQRVVLLKNAGLAAERLYDFLRTVPAKSILERYGFVLPDSGG